MSGCNWPELYCKRLKINMLLTLEREFVRSLGNLTKRCRRSRFFKPNLETACVREDPVPRHRRDNWRPSASCSDGRIKGTVGEKNFHRKSISARLVLHYTSGLYHLNAINNGHASYFPVKGVSRTLICMLTNRWAWTTVTYDGLPDTVVKKLLSNRYVVCFHSPRA